MLKELRERMQQLMQRAAPQGDSRPSEAQAATLATVQAANEDLKGELQSIKADRQEVKRFQPSTFLHCYEEFSVHSTTYMPILKTLPACQLSQICTRS